MEEIILVDEQDREVGFAEKVDAHRDGGRLHRAFSIVLFNSRGEMLLQLRAAAKYHFGGLWTNACCGHPRRGEELEPAARRRLREELGIDAELREVFAFTYTATDPRSGLTENEFDHVFVARFDGQVAPDPDEMDDVRWIDCAELERDLGMRPEAYTPWFARVIERLPELRKAVAS